MTTSRVNNGSTPLMSPLTAPKTEAEKAAAPAGAMSPALQTALTTPPGGGAKQAANVSISTGAKDRAEAHAKALDIARKTPDIREDRVAELKKQIAEGTYKVDSGNIADGMLREAIRDHLATNNDH